MRILSLNGGGTAGYATALFLEELERRTGERCAMIFDMITGVSTGGILAAGLAFGRQAGDLAELYRQHLPKIFQATWLPPWRWFVGQAKYNRGPLAKLIEDQFAFEEMGDASTSLMIHATQISPECRPQFWKSWRREHRHVKVSDVVLASTAAPTYFPPYVIGTEVYIDGAISANNPAACALAEAARCGQKARGTSILNIQALADTPPSFKKAQKMSSMADWAGALPSMLIDGNVEVAEYICRHVLGDSRYQNVEFPHPWPIDAWNNEVRRGLENAVKVLWNAKGDEVCEWLGATVKSPMEANIETTSITIKADTKQGSDGADQVDPEPHH